MSEDTTPLEQVCQHVTDQMEYHFSQMAQDTPAFHHGIPIQDFTPYLLVKILATLESINENVSEINKTLWDERHTI